MSRNFYPDSIEVWPGPMEGVMGKEFVEAVNSLHLTDFWLTPFFRLSENVPPKKILRKFIEPFLSGNVPVYVQLMGTNPELLVECARRFLDLGAKGIDFNCGCPSNRVVNGGAGGGILRNEQLIIKIMEELRKSLPTVELSIKLRTGYQNSNEVCIWLPEIAPLVNRIFLHYRTVLEGYKPVEGRVERFKKVISLVPNVPVIINGDIRDEIQGSNLIHQCGAKGVMVARGWLRDPWLLRRIAHGSGLSLQAGRERFWEQLISQNLHGGPLIELAKMIFGINDPHFKKLIGNAYL